ncbi:MAG: hypothetical protein JWO38_5771 [Gemmataceae bacterium]|nr:hypothetical protein [Gemmataceae bacterium]
MNSNDRSLWVDLTAARYLAAIEQDDFDTQLELWRVAATDPDLEAAFHEIHAGVIEEQGGAVSAAVGAAVEKHLTSGEVVRQAAGPVTVADVADELFRHAPDRLPAAAHALNERLRAAAEPLPADLGLTALEAWAEAIFGAAPTEYWRAFREAALKVRMRASAESEFRLAARRAKPATGDRP